MAELAREIGLHPDLGLSHQVSRLAKLVGRGDTTVVDAYLSPILRRYVDPVAERAGYRPRLRRGCCSCSPMAG